MSNRQRTSGILLPPAEAPGFRFAFTLGLSEHHADRAGFVAHLERLLAAHRRLLPPPPPGARPEEAPRAKGWLVAAAAGGVLGLFALVGLVAPDPRPEEQAVTFTTSSPSPSRSSTPERLPTSAPPTGKAPTRTAPASSPKPAKSRKAAVRKTRKPQEPPRTRQLCGAPSNPYGYTFCGGTFIYDPPSEICSHFACIGNFWNGKGYLVQCRDGEYSMSGGRRGACSHHDGVGRPVYR
ncbi:hypothetical protein ACSNOI_11505 [Actinomadura kijaniata]|uniref:hypothetical protein n=1 Tax=Actinomadura kijaniata TaxID=46161 RepID=UPI003F1DA326